MEERRSLIAVGATEGDSPLWGQLRSAHWDLRVAGSLSIAETLLEVHRPQVGLMLCPKPDDWECTLLANFLRGHRDVEWICALDANAATHPACRELILDHCFDHHTLPIDTSRLLVMLGHARGHALMRRRHEQHAANAGRSPIVGRSEAIRRQLRQIGRIAATRAPVLITGECGSGKELAARAIHRASTHAGQPFVALTCGNLEGGPPGNTFGAAEGGTLFLDDVGELSPELQAELLNFLEAPPAASSPADARPARADPRVIAATRADLEAAVAAGSFNEALYYRLDVLSLQVPPLRERRDDIETLAQHYFERFASERRARVTGFSRHAHETMRAYAWPGNVRELINRVRRALVMADSRLVAPRDLGLEGAELVPEALHASRSRAERNAIFLSLQHTGRNVTRSAQQLGVSRMTLYRLMAKHGIAY